MKSRAAILGLAVAFVLLTAFACPSAMGAEGKPAGKGPAQYPKFMTGVVVPMLTPFTEDNKLDEPVLADFTKWLCTQKVSALFPMGGTGEHQKLEQNERKRIIDVIVGAAPKGCAVMPGVGSTSLELTLDLALYAQKAGADAISVVVPDFIDEGEDAIFAYYKQINDAVSIPIMVYDPRGDGPRSVTPNLMDQFVATLKNVKGIKYRTDDIIAFTNMVRAADGKAAVLSGMETNYLKTLAAGGVGVVGGGCNLYPNLIARIHENYYADKWKEAQSDQELVNASNEAAERGSWPMGGKIALNAMGVVPITTVTRNSHREVSDVDVVFVREYFRDLKY